MGLKLMSLYFFNKKYSLSLRERAGVREFV